LDDGGAVWSERVAADRQATLRGALSDRILIAREERFSLLMRQVEIKEP
jgi:hypothetical protein